MYGKIFEQMYTGSMMGAGAMMFAVWPYVIAHMKPNRERDVFTVELNTKLMALLIGEREADIEKVIEKCCEPDPKSRKPSKDGRKLVKLGAFLYEVVNGAVYDKIRRADELREANRRRQEKFRENQKMNGKGEDLGKKSKVVDDSVEIPDGLQTEAFRAAWGEWLQHLKEKKSKTTVSAKRAQLKKCAALGESAAIAAINHSIAGSYQGIYESNSKANKPTGHVSAC